MTQRATDTTGRSLVFRLEAQRLDTVIRHCYNQREYSASVFRAAT